MKKLLTLVACAVLVMPLSAQTWSKALEKSAKAGDVEAQFTVGNAYLTGDGVKQNLKKATQWLFMAAQAGQADAIKALCTYYSDALEQVAAAGNADAQFALANFYETGNGVAQNQAKALELYGSAAAQGIAEAKPKVLGSYNAGIVILADAGDIDAQFALANFYAEGNGVAQNQAKALELYGSAAAQGIAEAKPKVLGSYNAGIVTLADAGDADAATQVADFLFNGTGGATKSEKEAARYYAIAYKAGNSKAGTKLVTIYNAYLNGRGVAQNVELANVYLAAAASAGVEEAKEKFYSKLSPQLEEAAESGDPGAMIAIAGLCDWGFPRYDDKQEMGRKWLLRAIEKGYINEVLDAMKKQNNGRIIDWSKVVFDNDPNYNGLRGYDYLEGWSQRGTTPYESAYYAALLFRSEYNKRGLKSLINQYKHPKARELYDDWYFQYEYEKFKIASDIFGFNGIDKVLINIDGSYRTTIPEKLTEQEVQELTDAIPEFSITPNDIRVLRDIELIYNEEGKVLKTKQKHKVDIYYLTGITALGPKSQFTCELTSPALTRPIIVEKTLGEYTLSTAPSKEFTAESSLKATDIVSENFRFRFRLYDEYNLVSLDLLENYNFIFKTYCSLNFNSLQIDILETDHVKYPGKYPWILLELESTENGNITKFNPSLATFRDGVIDDIEYEPEGVIVTKEDGSCIEFRNPNFIKGNSVIKIKYPDYDYYNIEGDEHKIDFKNVNNFISTLTTTPFDSIPTLLAHCEYAEGVDTSEEYKLLYLTNATKLFYGRTAEVQSANRDKYVAQRKERQEKEKWDTFWAEMTQKYGESQVKKLRNSKTWLMKGLDIRLLAEYIDVAYWTGEIRSYYGVEYKVVHKQVVHYLSDADGYAMYDVQDNTTRGWETVIRVYTKDNIIYDWVKF